jgi:hypothetical protein
VVIYTLLALAAVFFTAFVLGGVPVLTGAVIGAVVGFIVTFLVVMVMDTTKRRGDR